MIKKTATDGPRKLEAPQKVGEASAIEHELEAMLRVGRRNLDAIFAINRLTMDCIDRCAERQTEVWNRLSLNALNLVKMLGDPATGESPNPARPPEVSEAIELTLGHLREMSEIIARTNQELLDLISTRVDSGLKEVEEAAKRCVSVMLEAGAHTASAIAPDASQSPRHGEAEDK